MILRLNENFRQVVRLYETMDRFLKIEILLRPNLLYINQMSLRMFADVFTTPKYLRKEITIDESDQSCILTLSKKIGQIKH